MKKFKIFTFVLCLGIVLTGCNNTQKGAAIGTGGGAVLGAIVGKIAGNTGVGAALGAAVGAGTGAIIGNRMDKAKKRAEADSGILFATNKADLNTAAKNSLASFAKVLNEYKDCDVAIYGHTDNTGSDAINQPLSVSRANSVSNYLKSCGVSASQIKSVEGQGSSNPVADNSTVEGRKQNRRVEVYMYASEQMVKAAENGTLQ